LYPPYAPSSSCGSFQEEILDIQAYRSFIPAVLGPAPASTAIAAFHNLVTSTVSSPSYLQGAERRYYCVKDVLQAEQILFGADLGTVVAGQPVPGVPGVAAQHRLLTCA